MRCRACYAPGRPEYQGYCAAHRRGCWYERKAKAVAKALRRIAHRREDTADATIWARGRIVLFKPAPDASEPAEAHAWAQAELQGQPYRLASFGDPPEPETCGHWRDPSRARCEDCRRCYETTTEYDMGWRP